MKCMGFDMKEEDTFCGGYGKKVENDYWDLTKHKYICIGHPLGWITEGTEVLYLLDLGDREEKLYHNQSIVWAEMLGNKNITKNDNEIIKELLDKKLLLDLKDFDQIKIFMQCVPHRQGYSVVKDNKHAIVLGSAPIYIPANHLNIWRLSNGKNNLEAIMKELNLSQEEVVKQVLESIYHGTIILKND